MLSQLTLAIAANIYSTVQLLKPDWLVLLQQLTSQHLANNCTVDTTATVLTAILIQALVQLPQPMLLQPTNTTKSTSLLHATAANMISATLNTVSISTAIMTANI